MILLGREQNLIRSIEKIKGCVVDMVRNTLFTFAQCPNFKCLKHFILSVSYCVWFSKVGAFSETIPTHNISCFVKKNKAHPHFIVLLSNFTLSSRIA